MNVKQTDILFTSTRLQLSVYNTDTKLLSVMPMPVTLFLVASFLATQI